MTTGRSQDTVLLFRSRVFQASATTKVVGHPVGWGRGAPKCIPGMPSYLCIPDNAYRSTHNKPLQHEENNQETRKQTTYTTQHTTHTTDTLYEYSGSESTGNSVVRFETLLLYRQQQSTTLPHQTHTHARTRAHVDRNSHVYR